MSKIPVSVAIVTKNEARNIKDALESVKDFDDIVVVDAFSSDNTTEICREYTKRVYEHEWQGYAGQKQTAIDYANNGWVLILDADERVTLELKQEIMEKVKENALSGFYIPRKNFFLGKWIRNSGWWPDHTLRLFRKDVSKMEPRAVHEKVNVNGPVGHIRAPFEHYTYRTISDYIGKMDNYAALSAEELDNRGFISSFISMLFSPMAVFIKMYLVRQGFRDGIHGLVLAVLYSFYTFLKYAKVLERKGGF
ncbi:glycosyl transferase family 2 [bacterium BMS3Bbin09]|nr:glycosyl transferase family 2 [bacterium BMS3Bbin09]